MLARHDDRHIVPVWGRLRVLNEDAHRRYLARKFAHGNPGGPGVEPARWRLNTAAFFKLCGAHGLNQVDVADATASSRSMLSKLICGHRRAGDRFTRKLCDFFEASLLDLFEEAVA